MSATSALDAIAAQAVGFVRHDRQRETAANEANQLRCRIRAVGERLRHLASQAIADERVREKFNAATGFALGRLERATEDAARLGIPSDLEEVRRELGELKRITGEELRDAVQAKLAESD